MSARISRSLLVLSTTAALAVASVASAEERGTKDEAIALVNRGVAAIVADGPNAFPAITQKDGAFVDRDLYIVVFNKDCIIQAHGYNKALVGVNMMEVADPDGVKFCQAFWKQANSSAEGNGWVNFKFTHPQTRKIAPKVMWVQKTPDTNYVVVAGAYPGAN